ncbi:Pyridoxamine 5'-phosphate oxidase family protein OS=Streptomyces tendae OX=1932 GN=GUR47_33335 PE=4 SV=1 [Streptomyces tendae]
MGKTYERIDGRLRTFIEAQPLFFTATAPLAGDGTVNLSPKGLTGCFAVLDELTVAYLDFAGSNAETIAHLRENGRITLMWCAFQGPPNIVRVHGRGEPVFRNNPRFRTCSPTSRTSTPPRTDCARSSSCTPNSSATPAATPSPSWPQSDRDLHGKRFAREDDASLSAYFTKKEHIASSIDGLPGLPLPLPPSTV